MTVYLRCYGLPGNVTLTITLSAPYTKLVFNLTGFRTSFFVNVGQIKTSF